MGFGGIKLLYRLCQRVQEIVQRRLVMSKKFDNWNEVKKHTEHINNIPQFKSREIYHVKIGENIGFEQSGKGDDFENLRKKLDDLMFDGDFTPPNKSAGRPEGNCKAILSEKSQKVNKAVGDE